ncbi:hypothetical protein P4B35_21165 [Pontiellaceae bacterium B12227]|nr:hypothetical protein [Pontiellaceae bacterium B12227]
MKLGLLLCAGLTAVSVQANVGGFCSSIEVDGTNAFVGAGQILLSVDVSDSSAPTLRSTLYLPGLIEDLLLDGTNLFAACGDAGVHRVNISNLWKMERVETYDSDGHAYGLATDATSLYLADGVAGLCKLDPDTLSPVSMFATNAPAMDVLVEGGSIYLLDHFNGLIELDVALNVSGGYDRIAFGSRLASDGSSIFTVDGEGKVIQLDLASLSLVTNRLVGIPTVGIAVSASEQFIARNASGVMVLDGAVLPTIGNAADLKIDAGKLYVADGFGGLSIYDEAGKALLGSFTTVSRSRATAIYSGHAYVAAGNRGVTIFDLSDFSAAGSVAVSNALDVSVSGSMLLVSDAFQGLELYDLSDPVVPEHLGACKLPSPAAIRCSGAAGSSAYAVEAYNVHRIDISNPALPVPGSQWTSADYIFDLDMVSSNVALATAGGLKLLTGDLIPMSENPVDGQTVSVDGTDALVGWNRVDLSDPLTPVASTNLSALIRAIQLTLSGDTIYGSADDGGLAVVALPPDGPADSDGDGLSDVFEQMIIDAVPDDAFATFADVNPKDDFDGDGLANDAEQFAGTSPIDPDSVFAICGLEGEASGHSISWYSVEGHSYSVHKSTNLVDGFYLVRPGILATEPINTFTDTEASDCAMYMISID